MVPKKLLATTGALGIIALGWWWSSNDVSEQRLPATAPGTKGTTTLPQRDRFPPRFPQPSVPREPPALAQPRQPSPGYPAPHPYPAKPQANFPTWGGSPDFFDGAPQRPHRFRPLSDRERQRIESADPFGQSYWNRPGRQAAPADITSPGGNYQNPQPYGLPPGPNPGYSAGDREPQGEQLPGSYPTQAPAFEPLFWPHPWAPSPAERYPHREGGSDRLYTAR